MNPRLIMIHTIAIAVPLMSSVIGWIGWGLSGFIAGALIGAFIGGVVEGLAQGSWVGD